MSAALSERIAAARAVADRLAALSPVAEATRARHVRDGRLHDAGAAFVMLLRAVDGLRTGEIADALGLSAEAVSTSLHRSPFVAADRGAWHIVEGPDLRALDALTVAAERDEADGLADRSRLDAFRRSRGRVPPLLWTDALRALFADGVERSTQRVHIAFDGGACVYVTRNALRGRPDVVEPAGDDRWQRVPSAAELRAEVERLRAENDALRERLGLRP